MRNTAASLVFVLRAVPGGVAGKAPAREKPDAKAGYDPASRYAKRRIEGWDVLVNRRLLRNEHQELREQTVSLLGDRAPPGRGFLVRATVDILACRR
jgi:hypothetical protein